MTKRSKRIKKMRTLAMFLLILAIIGANIVVTYALLSKKNPLFEDKVKEKNITYLYSFYVNAEPNLHVPYRGSADAKVAIVGMLDVSSEESRFFFTDIFPRLQSDFIETGKVKFFTKNYIVMADINEKNARFYAAKSLFCVNELNGSSYYTYYIDRITAGDMGDRKRKGMEKYGIDDNNFKSCIESGNNQEIIDEAIENENSILGLNQRFYIGFNGKNNVLLSGVPKFERFSRVINEQLLQIGG